MDQRPPQPPEGRLIADAADHLDLSIREAARRAGISYGRWRQIVMGYQNVSPGSFAPVRAPARTLAKMAAVVGITPEQMEAEGQRPDAAEAMRQEQERHAAARLTPADVDAALERGPGDFPDFDPAVEAVVRPHLKDVRALVKAAVLEYRVPVPTGGQVFGDGTREARIWDDLIAAGQAIQPPGGFSLYELAKSMATGRARDEAGRSQGRAAGLILMRG